MNCHMCGQREGTVHLLELINGRQKSVWLCSICASGRTDLPVESVSGQNLGQAGSDSGEPASLASFLGRVFEDREPTVRVAACPTCGYEFQKFQDSNQLGCAACYPHFRPQVLPILARYHRHASHLGKVPRREGAAASQQGELTRIRVALEKAIRGEDYEEAARLRDAMRKLAEARDEGRGKGSQEGRGRPKGAAADRNTAADDRGSE